MAALQKAVQIVEGRLRNLRSAIEARLDARIPSDHPTLRWLVERAASLLNRFKVHADGNTACQAPHVERSSEKVDEFGEQVFF